MESKLSARTRSVRAAIGSDEQFGAVVPPLHLTSNFTFAGFDEPRRYDYTRSGNPTRDALAEALTSLEGGTGTIVTSSGMSAIALVCQLLRPEDTIVVSYDCYGGSHRLFSAIAERGLARLHFADLGEPRSMQRAFDLRPRLVWLESPSNPLLRVTDIARVAELCRLGGCLLAVDNTFLSPVLQQPLLLGADLAVHSTTKYLNGHSDVVGGAVVAGNRKLFEDLSWWANCLGLAGAPFDSYLTLRGVRTLHVRLRQHEENARRLAEMLSRHRAVERVHYPGLPSHPGHAIAARQQAGFGAMVSFEIAPKPGAVKRFVEALRCFSLAESLGGVESLVAHPATMTHAAMSPEARRRAGIRDNLIRLSVGVEDAGDLIADVEAALYAATGVRPVEARGAELERA